MGNNVQVAKQGKVQLSKMTVTLEVEKMATVKKKKKQDTTTADIKLTNTEGKNLDDVAALQEIIKEQNAEGAKIPTDANLVAKCGETGEKRYTSGYIWNSDGRLEGIYWVDCNMKGSLTLEKLPALKTFICYHNQLSSLYISKNTALTRLYCRGNKLSSLDLTNNKNVDNLRYDYDTVTVIGWEDE